MLHLSVAFEQIRVPVANLQTLPTAINLFLFTEPALLWQLLLTKYSSFSSKPNNPEYQ